MAHLFDVAAGFLAGCLFLRNAIDYAELVKQMRSLEGGGA